MSAMIAIYELQQVQPMVDVYVFSYLRTCAAYDSTVKAVGFDEDRVRYRQQRRAMIRGIISHLLIGKALLEYAETETQKQKPLDSQQAVREDLQEDLDQIDPSRLSGLGISNEQLRAWLDLAR